MTKTILSLLIVGLLVGCGGDPNKKANELFVEATVLVASAEEKTGEAAIKDYEQALTKLNKIISDYSESDLAVKLLSDQTLFTGKTMIEIEERVKRAEAERVAEWKAKRFKKLKEDLLKFDLVGSYEVSYEEKGERLTVKLVILDNGKVQTYLNGKIDNVTEVDWVTGKELSLGSGVYRVDHNGHLTLVASEYIYVCSLGFPNHWRFDLSQEEQVTYKKIK